MRIEREQAVAVIVDYQAKLVPVMNENEKLLHNSRILLEGSHRIRAQNRGPRMLPLPSDM